MAKEVIKTHPCIYFTESVLTIMVGQIGDASLRKIIARTLPADLAKTFHLSVDNVKIEASCEQLGDYLKGLHNRLYEFAEVVFGVHLARDFWIKAIYEARREYGQDVTTRLVEKGLVPLIVSAHGSGFF